MQRYSMFPGRKNQYYENDYNTQSSLQIQFNICQIIHGVFHRTRTKNFTIHMETQKTSNSQSSLKKNGAGGINLPDFRLYYSHQDSVVLAQNRTIDQRNKIESPEINPCTYRYLVFDKGGKIYNGGKVASSINGAGKAGQLYVKE